MYSVIIPTMWRGKELQKMLPLVNDHPLVSEIIIIDNDRNATPQWYSEWCINKPKVIRCVMKQNIGVNPAWDYAIGIASNDMLCLLSDDVDFDIKVFDFLSDKLSPNDSCVGPSREPIYHDLLKHGIKIEQYGIYDKMQCGYGVLLFLNKQNYVPIPSTLKIFFGDVWIFETHRYNGKIPRKIRNFNFKTALATTSNSFMNNMGKEKQFLKTMCEYIYMEAGDV